MADPEIDPGRALHTLAEQLRAQDTVISPFVVEPTQEPELGMRAASGPRAAQAPGEYALLFETVREGYLLHYGEPRVLRGHDDDLALLAGDYLYARGLERLATLGDLHAVGVLADLISRSAQIHAEAGGDDEAIAERASSLWLHAAEAIGFGTPEHPSEHPD
jgi:hypothetical protein